ncbi:ABC transporter substrate-binding protein [Vibrio sp. 10N.286.49.B3]|uniref:ABC transporter substrate-binding protein n=1 Tax=Vibrio sp. 10N.286.49.B3 TaxID=1880855 RepID=UPI000C848DD0|nr:ABC transporter substrate-binding protein [Vibrio sp. 10N.286.49.B3]PMH46725.1 ABC transporter substrate-binding protein [Vibrio sp. 10N.286.49.B3]
MKILLKLTLTLCCFSLLAGCNDELDHSEIRQHGFIVCGHSTPSSFNPQLVDSGVTSEALSTQIFNSLTHLNPVTHQPIPSLAKDWQVNDAGTEYTFTLHTDVWFQSTQWFTPTRPLNAEDVVFSFKRIIDHTHPFHYINNARYPWFSGIGFQNLLVDVQAIDTKTVKFILNRPNNTFLSNISTSHAVIHSAEYAKVLIAKNEKHLLDSKPIGTGPFYLDEYQANDFIRLRRHDNYWHGAAKVDQVVFDISHRGTGTLAKLLRHECDVLHAPISSQLPIIQQQTEHLEITEKPTMNVAFIALNTMRPALNDPRVRKALSLAINRQSILDSVYYGTGTKAFTLLPPSSWAYQKDTSQIRYDRNYALALLKEAGYESGLALTMSVPLEPRIYDPSPKKTAELIQSNLANIGVEITLLTDERYSRSDSAQMIHADLSLTGWIGDTGDPDNFFRPLLSCHSDQAGINVSMWCNSDFDSLLDLALEADHGRYRLNLYHQVQNILNEELPVIPLTHGVQLQVHTKTLTGFKTSPFHTQSFDLVERK